MDLDSEDTTRSRQPPPDSPGSTGIQDVLEGRTTTSRTITAEDLAAVALPDLDTLRRQTPGEPDHSQGYDPAKAADYAMALALAPSTLNTPLRAKDVLEQLTEKVRQKGRALTANSLLFASGGRVKLAHNVKWIDASTMKKTFDIFWQAKKDQEQYSATRVARLLIGGPGGPEKVGRVVRGYWMAAGLGDYAITPNGAREVVRKAVYELADVFTTAGRQPDPRLIAQRIYAPGEEPLENQTLIVEEFLRQHAESAPLTATSDTAAPTGLDTIPLNDLEQLRDSVPGLLTEPFSDPRLAADYGTALALAHSRSGTPIDPAPVSAYLTQDSDKFHRTASGLLFAGGATLKVDINARKYLTAEFLRQSIDVAYQQRSNKTPHTPHSAAVAVAGTGLAANYVRGFWMAAGLGEYAVTEGGARDVVRKAVRELAVAFLSAGKEPDPLLIAQRVYSPGRRAEVQHVVMVEEFLRQHAAVEEVGGAASEGGLNEVLLDADRLRESMPEPPGGEDYDQAAAADYAAHLALAQSPGAPPLEPSAYGKHFAPPKVTSGKSQIAMSRALLFASGAQVTLGRNKNVLFTVDKMRQGFALAGQVDDKGEPLTMTQAASKMGSGHASYAVWGFWLAAGLRGDGLRRGGARDVIRKAVDTLAG
ncbi:hypothetical protein ACFUMI_38870, partial [Streptomyces sp. NPDC057273]|uniref:hypothetical protein n=1 Tax=Streptomyces sp. NPDC057273 TaxID=3346080 RepID=UPI0036410B61